MNLQAHGRVVPMLTILSPEVEMGEVLLRVLSVCLVGENIRVSGTRVERVVGVAGSAPNANGR
jgi:hypothetical protein